MPYPCHARLAHITSSNRHPSPASALHPIFFCVSIGARIATDAAHESFHRIGFHSPYKWYLRLINVHSVSSRRLLSHNPPCQRHRPQRQRNRRKRHRQQRGATFPSLPSRLERADSFHTAGAPRHKQKQKSALHSLPTCTRAVRRVADPDSWQ